MTEIDAYLKGKMFTLYSCSPLKAACRLSTGNVPSFESNLANFFVSTGQFCLADHSEESGHEDKRVISLVQFSFMEIPFETGTSTCEEKMIIYRINIGIGSENDATFMEFYLLPSMAEDVSKRDAHFGYYPVLLCKASTEISLYVREWLQSFFECTITKCSLNTQLLVDLVSWWGSMLHDISIEGAEDDLEILRTNENIRLEYRLSETVDIGELSVDLNPGVLVDLEISSREKDGTLIDEIELHVFKNADIIIGALSLNCITTNSVSLHMDGNLKFSANASDGLVLAILYYILKSFEDEEMKGEEEQVEEVDEE